ncbi:unnamed protein product [Mortierella alpina]
MGATALNCVTTDPEATTFYGLIFGDDYAISKYPNRHTGVVALVKSSTSPADPLSMTWSTVSKIGYKSLTGLENAPPEHAFCAINSKSVFTFLIHFGHQSAGSLLPAGPRIYQFNPNGETMDVSFNYKGTGSWSNVTIESTNPVIVHQFWYSPRLQFVYDGPVETLIYSYFNNFSLELSTLNEATNTLVHAATWNMNATLYGDHFEDGIIIGDGLHTNSEGRLRDHISAYLRLASCPGTLYVLAVRGGFSKKDSDHVLISQTRYIDGALALAKPVNVSRQFTYYSYFAPINGQFALMRDDDQMDAMTLSGPSLGNFYASISINISDSIDPKFNFEAVQLGGGSKIGLVVGVAAVVVVLVGAGIAYFFWRKRSKNRTTGVAINNVTAAPALPPKNHAYHQGPSFV